MSVSKRYLPIAIACVFVGSTAAAVAGSQSALDPDSYPKASGSGYGSPSHSDVTTSQTYVTMPAPEGKSNVKLPKLKAPKISMPKIGLHKDKKQQPQSMMAEMKNQNESKPIKEAKAPKQPKAPKEPKEHKEKASETKTADKGSGNGILDKTKNFGGGIASGAKSIGSKIGDGFKSAGEKMKGGTESIGSKVAKLSPFHGKEKEQNSANVKTAKANKLPLGNRMSTGSDIATGNKTQTRTSKTAANMATGSSKTASKSAVGSTAATGKQVATSLPVKTMFGQTTGDSWTPGNKHADQTNMSSNAPNKASGGHHSFFGKFAKLPFGGHDKKQPEQNNAFASKQQGM